ncbi:MAG: DNA polymerase III subunit gamma/tau [Acidobacteria bacterium]|nr:DNA polymerase III subunit gamma/tau [Acidobacteriota bacterium]
MTYQVLARSWRPQRFADLIGQDAVVKTLQNALTGGTLGHAYLFSGLRGVGKTTVARLLAKAVNCAEGPTAEPCDACVACREIAAGSSLDVVELDGASNRGIDDVRELRELLRYRPSRDRYRVIIIDEVHMLTREAFNALLKSLEEPPPYILFIFATTEQHKVPATILSRCQQLEFRPVSTRLITAHLAAIAEQESFGLTPEAATAVARAAEGSVRDALSLIDQLRAFSGDRIDGPAVAEVLGMPRAEQVARLLELLAGGEAADALSLLREELAAGHDAVVLYHEVGHALRRMLHLRLDPELEPELANDNRERLTELAGKLDNTALVRMLGLWVEQEPLVRDGANRELGLEVACLRLARWPVVRDLEATLTGQPPSPAAGGGGGGRRRTTSGSAAAGDSRADSPHPEGSAGRLLSEALWEDRPRIASAVDSAEVVCDDGVVRLVLPADRTGLADYARTPEAMSVLNGTVERVIPDCNGVVIEVEGESGDGNGPLPLSQATEDEGVRLVQRVLGGEVVAVRPDRREAER